MFLKIQTHLKEIEDNLQHFYWITKLSVNYYLKLISSLLN